MTSSGPANWRVSPGSSAAAGEAWKANAEKVDSTKDKCDRKASTPPRYTKFTSPIRCYAEFCFVVLM
jgi:hypothetical protein